MIITEQQIKNEVKKALKKILRENVTRDELERLFPDGEKIQITQELAQQMLDYALENIVNDFFHLEAPRISVTKIPSIGAFCFEKPIRYSIYNRRLKNCYGEDATKNDLYFFWPLIRINNSVKASKKSWFNTICHELCHMLVYYRNCICPTRPHGKEFKYEASEFYNLTNGYINVTTYAESNEIELSQDEIDKQKQKVAKETKKLNYYVCITESPTKEFKLYRLSSEKILTDYIKIMETAYYKNKYKDEFCTFYHITNEEFSEKLYNKGYKTTARTMRFWRMGDDQELKNEIINHTNDSNYMEKIYTYNNKETELNEEFENEDGIVTLQGGTPLSGEIM